MIENKIEEQPKKIAEANLATDIVDKKNTVPAEEKGSLLGKFKKVEDLSKAYESLQKEFTKKCQKISELENLQTSDNEEETSPQEEINWEKEVETFLSSNKRAMENIAEISSEIAKAPTLASSPQGLEQALNNVLAKKYRPASELLEDEEFLNKQIFSNKKIKEKILKEYLQEIAENKVTPLISEHSGTGIHAMPSSRPTSFEDAGNLVSRMLKK